MTELSRLRDHVAYKAEKYLLFGPLEKALQPLLYTYNWDSQITFISVNGGGFPQNF